MGGEGTIRVLGDSENRIRNANHAEVVRVLHGIVGTGMGSRVDMATHRKPTSFPASRSQLFQGAVQNELHAWVPQAALGSGVPDDSQVIPHHAGGPWGG
eukprot:14362261-Heterocapsa_arctica.AAC.1